MLFILIVDCACSSLAFVTLVSPFKRLCVCVCVRAAWLINALGNCGSLCTMECSRWTGWLGISQRLFAPSQVCEFSG